MKLDYSIGYGDSITLCALSANVFIGDWIDTHDKNSIYFERMIKALAVTSEICVRKNASTFREHHMVLSELITCCELYCEVVAETTDHHKHLPFKQFMNQLKNKGMD